MEHFKCLNLTHPLNPHVPTWNGSCGFCLETQQDDSSMFCVQHIKMHGGVGTHMDAPSHGVPQGKSIAEIPIEQLIVPACVIDVSPRAHADYEVSEKDIEQYESQYGRIPKGALVIVYTSWSRLWSEPNAYRNIDAEGQMHFPALSGAAAAVLIERDISGIAIDTLSPDCLDASFSVHKIMLEAGKYIIENIAQCVHMPPVGAYVIALPLPLEDAAEAPMRIIGLIPLKKG